MNVEFDKCELLDLTHKMTQALSSGNGPRNSYTLRCNNASIMKILFLVSME